MADTNLPPELIEQLREFTQAVRDSTGALNESGAGFDRYLTVQERAERAAAGEAQRIKAEADRRIAEEKAALDAAIGKWKKAGDATVNFARSASTVEGAFNQIGATTAMVVTSLTSLAKNIPFVGAAIAGLGKGAGEVVKFVTEQTGKAFGTFEKLSKSGIVENFESMRNAADRTGLMFGELEQVIGKNSESLALLGTSAISGSKKMQDVLAINREAAEEFQKLGVGFQEFSQIQSDYVAMQTRAGFARSKSDKELAAGAKEYAEQLTAISRLTGKSREQLQKEQDKRMTDVRFRSKLAQMAAKGDEEGAKRLQRMMDMLPAEMSEGLKNMIAAGGAVTEKSAAELAASFGAAGTDIVGLTRKFDKGQITVEEFVQSIAKGSKDYMDKVGPQLGTIVGADSPITKNLVAFADTALLANKNLKEVTAEIEKGIKAGQAANDPTAKVAQQARDIARDIEHISTGTKTMMEVVSKVGAVMKEFTGYIKDFTDGKGGTAAVYGTGAAIAASAVAGIVATVMQYMAGKKLLDTLTRTSTAIPSLPGSPGVPGSPTVPGGGARPLPTRPPSPMPGGGGGLGGAGTGNLLTGMAAGLKAFANPAVLLGSAGFGAAIAAVGAGLAGATWIMGKALPSLAEGMKSFENLDGDKLISTGKGVGALGAGLAVFGAGGMASGIGAIASNMSEGIVKFFGGKTPLDKLVEFSKLDIDGPKTEANAKAFVAFSKAMAASGVGAGLSGFGTAASAIGDGLANFFGAKLPVDKFVAFSKLDIDAAKAKNNAEALGEFSVALVKFGAGGVASAFGQVAGTFADGFSIISNKLLGTQGPIEKFLDFSKLPIKPEDVKIRSEALKNFAEAMSAMGRGNLMASAGQSAQMVTDAINKVFSNKTPVEKFIEFSKLNIDTERTAKNAEAFRNFAQAMSTYPSATTGVVSAAVAATPRMSASGGGGSASGGTVSTAGTGAATPAPVAPAAGASGGVSGSPQVTPAMTSGGARPAPSGMSTSGGGSVATRDAGAAGGTAGAVDASGPGGAATAGVSGPPAGIQADGITQYGNRVRIGNTIREGGTVSWRTNNPGNVSYLGLARKHGAIGRWMKPDGDLQQRTTGIAIMPTMEAGDELKKELWRRPLYSDTNIATGVHLWTRGSKSPDLPPDVKNYAKDLAAAAGVDINTPIPSLSDDQLGKMIKKQRVWEGFKEGRILQAANGALIQPQSGGTLVNVAEAGKAEAIVPLPDGRTIPVTIKNSGEQTAALKDIFDGMNMRLDEVIDLLSQGNKLTRNIAMNNV